MTKLNLSEVDDPPTPLQRLRASLAERFASARDPGATLGRLDRGIARDVEAYLRARTVGAAGEALADAESDQLAAARAALAASRAIDFTGDRIEPSVRTALRDLARGLKFLLDLADRWAARAQRAERRAAVLEPAAEALAAAAAVGGTAAEVMAQARRLHQCADAWRAARTAQDAGERRTFVREGNVEVLVRSVPTDGNAEQAALAALRASTAPGHSVVLQDAACRALLAVLDRDAEAARTAAEKLAALHVVPNLSDCAALRAYLHDAATRHPDAHLSLAASDCRRLDAEFSRLVAENDALRQRANRFEREVTRLRPGPNEVHDLQPRERAIIERLGRPGDDWDGVQLDREDAATVCALVQRLQGAVSNRMRPAADQEPVAAPPTPSTAHLARLEALVVRAKAELAQRCPVLITLPEVEQFATDLGGLLAAHRIGGRLDAQVAARQARLDAATTELARAARQLAAAHPDADGRRTKVEAVHEALHELADARAGSPPLPPLPPALEAELTGPGSLTELRRAIRRALADADAASAERVAKNYRDGVAGNGGAA